MGEKEKEMQEERRVCLHGERTWAGYMRGGSTNDGPWEFADTYHGDDPSTAARVICGERWTSGTHPILVVSAVEAREFRITLETEEVESHE